LVYFENYFELDRYSQGQACDSEYQSGGGPLGAEDILQQFGRGISNLDMITKVRPRGYRYTQANDTANSIQRAQVLPGNRESIERRDPRSIASSRNIDLFSQAAKNLRLMPRGRHHTAEEEQVAALNRGYVGTERLGRRRELNADLA
jgi:hypothetical protein